MSSNLLIDENINLEKVCRSCMGNKQLRPIFGSFLDKMLSSVADIEVDPSDSLPHQLCVQCVLQVSRSFTFKQQCQRIDSSLRMFVAQRKLNVTKKESKFEQDSHLPVQNHDNSTTMLNDSNCILILHTEKLEESNSSNNFAIHPMEASYHSPPVCHSPQFLGDCQPENIVDINTSSFVIPEFQDSSVIVEQFIEEQEFDETRPEEQAGSSLDMLQNEGLEETATRFECKVCLKQFSQARILKRHSKTHLPYKHACDVCGKSFAESSNLTKHKKMHTGELRNVKGKPYLCISCGKKFKWSSSLSKHMKVQLFITRDSFYLRVKTFSFQHHTKSRLYYCKFCPKYYVEARSLNIHVRSHTGDKPYNCSFCEKKFSQKCNLEKHERVHTGIKPFQCTTCGKSFTQSGYLIIHIRKHTKERPYACSECGKRFAATNALKAHKKIHSESKDFSCQVCPLKFVSSKQLTNHLKTHQTVKNVETSTFSY